MSGQLHDIGRALIRNILFSDQIKKGTVRRGAFKGGGDGMSMTESRGELLGLDCLNDYILEISKARASAPMKLGVAVFSADLAKDIGLVWRPDPNEDHKYGHLHVLGPIELEEDLRRELARLASISGWSRPPE